MAVLLSDVLTTTVIDPLTPWNEVESTVKETLVSVCAVGASLFKVTLWLLWSLKTTEVTLPRWNPLRVSDVGAGEAVKSSGDGM